MRRSGLISKSILRTYGGVFDQEVKINIGLIASKVNSPEKDVINTLKQLETDSIISLKLGKSDTEITFIQPREDDKTINRIAKNVEASKQIKEDQVNHVIAYINNDTVCKSVQLLTYFGESKLENCGICSVCISKRKVMIKVIMIKLKNW